MGRIHCFSVDGEAGGREVFSGHHHSQLILVLAAIPLANTGNHKLLGCLAGLKWEYRNGAAADRDHLFD